MVNTTRDGSIESKERDFGRTSAETDQHIDRKSERERGKTAKNYYTLATLQKAVWKSEEEELPEARKTASKRI